MKKKKSASQINKKRRVARFLYILFLIIFIPLVILFFIPANKQKTGNVSEKIITEDEIDGHLAELNEERFTEEQKKPIRAYITEKFIEFGFSVSEQNTGKFINIIAKKPQDTESDYILVGAHYDSYPGTKGMDDNASGVSALLAIAKHASKSNIIFVAFDGEEYNLSGSQFFVKTMENKPSLVIILETLGVKKNEPNTQMYPPFYNILYPHLFKRLKQENFVGNFSASVCALSASAFCENYEAFASADNLQVFSIYLPPYIILRQSLVRTIIWDMFRSDHSPFLFDGIPSVMITDTGNFRNKNYHLPTDTLESLDTSFITQQANAVLQTLSKY